MKQALLLSVIIFSANCQISAQNQNDVTEKDTVITSVKSSEAKKAIDLALNYVTLFSDGKDLDKIVSLCSVPFSWADTEIISDFNLLKKKHIEAINLKGKGRAFEVDTAYIKSITQVYSRQNTPIEVYHVKFLLKQPKASPFVIFVQMSDIPKIVGVED